MPSVEDLADWEAAVEEVAYQALLDREHNQMTSVQLEAKAEALRKQEVQQEAKAEALQKKEVQLAAKATDLARKAHQLAEREAEDAAQRAWFEHAAVEIARQATELARREARLAHSEAWCAQQAADYAWQTAEPQRADAVQEVMHGGGGAQGLLEGQRRHGRRQLEQMARKSPW
jgi:hypothetical protein